MALKHVQQNEAQKEQAMVAPTRSVFAQPYLKSLGLVRLGHDIRRLFVVIFHFLFGHAPLAARQPNLFLYG
jgi:hypothetical protein